MTATSSLLSPRSCFTSILVNLSHPCDFQSCRWQIAATLGNLSMTYTDLGSPSTAVRLLQRALEINKFIHSPDHPSIAITLSHLSTAYRHLGDMQKSEESAKRALKITEEAHGPAHPGAACLVHPWMGVIAWLSFHLHNVHVCCVCELAVIQSSLCAIYRVAGNCALSAKLQELSYGYICFATFFSKWKFP